jgi:ankyrin repeat protein
MYFNHLVFKSSPSKKLLNACTFGRISEAFALLRNGTNPNIVDHENRSPLMLILESKGEFNEDFVQLLIQKIRENGGDLDIEDNTNGTTALIKACAKSRTSAALQLIEAGASLDFVDVGEEDKLTALDYAVGRKLDIVINAIRKKGGHTFKELDSSTANTLNESLSSSVAHVVASASLPYKESTLIWKQGTGAANTGSVLVILAQNGYTKEAHKIIGLSRTASLIGRDSDGGLPELWDVMSQVRGRGGSTRLMAIARVNGRLSPGRARALIRDHNADPMKTDKLGRSAIEWAVCNVNIMCLNVFLENDKDGRAASEALIYASYWDQEMTVKMLLARGARQVPYENFMGSTAMHYAAMSGNIHVLTLLCNAPDADDAMNTTDGNEEIVPYGPSIETGRTPLGVAYKNNKKECIALLQSKGAMRIW